MLVLHRRLAIAGVIAAAAIAVPAAAMASGSSSPPGKPAPTPAPAPSASKPAAAPSGAASSPAKQAQSDSSPAPVRAFAARLGISTNAAGPAFKEIAGLNMNGGIDPASPAFAAIARQLGVSPAQLAAAWDAVSQSAPGN